VGTFRPIKQTFDIGDRMPYATAEFVPPLDKPSVCASRYKPYLCSKSVSLLTGRLLSKNAQRKSTLSTSRSAPPTASTQRAGLLEDRSVG
jgi:hypothetical protein